MKRIIIASLLVLLPAAAPAFDFAPGWNLAGNGKDKVIDVAATFGDPNVKASVTTVWKWDPANQKWAFYAPGLADGGVAYAASKGYQALRSILPGEGFWVNAASAFATADPAAAAMTLKPWQLLSGWNLVATGAGVSPVQFSGSIAPFTATTLWAWDRSSSAWYFYAPTLSAQALADYIANKQYRSFGDLALAHGTGFWVNRAGSGAGPTAGLPALDQAKQMIAELRSTGSSWVNATDSGALDAQVATMSRMGSGISVPEATTLTYRLSALNAGETLYRKIKAGQTGGYVASFNSQTSTTTYSTYYNEFFFPSANPVWGYSYYRCATNAIGASQPLASVTCLIYDENATTYRYNWSDGTTSAVYMPGKTLVSSTQTTTYVRIVFSESQTAGVYAYSAELRQTVATYPNSTTSTLASGFAGTLQKTFDANGVGQTLTLSGELPSTAAGAAKMTVNAQATRTVVSGGTCSVVGSITYCPTRYDVSGAIAGVDAQGGTVYSLSLDSGSHITTMESALGDQLAASTTEVNLSATLQVAGARFAGSIAAQDFSFDADNVNWAPTRVTLTGTFSDVSSGGAGVIFNGSVVATIDNYGSYHSIQAQSASNYPHAVATINGSLQLPSRPLMGLTLVATRTGATTGTLTGQYTYGDGVTLTIAGTADSATVPRTATLTLTNQDDVVLSLLRTGNGSLRKGTTELGSVQNGIVYYSDGAFESLK